MDPNGQSLCLRMDIDLSSLSLTGRRIRLRSITPRYAEAVFSEFTAEICRYMLPRPADTIDDTMEFISSAVRGMEARRDLVLVILSRDDEEFLGCCGIHSRRIPRTPELGIWLKKSAHGRRFGREAIGVACRWALQHLEFEYLIYPVDRRNAPSRMIPESMGGVIIEEKRVPTMRGTELDEVVYKLTPEALAHASSVGWEAGEPGSNRP